MKNVLSNLSNLSKADVDKLVRVPVDLSKLNDAVKNDVYKTDAYKAKVKDIEHKIADITKLAANTTLNAKLYGVKSEIHSITNSATTAALNGVKTKISNITNLTTTTALTAVENKISDHSKYITTPDFNKLTAENFAARLAQANLASILLIS